MPTRIVDKSKTGGRGKRATAGADRKPIAVGSMVTFKRRDGTTSRGEVVSVYQLRGTWYKIVVMTKVKGIKQPMSELFAVRRASIICGDHGKVYLSSSRS